MERLNVIWKRSPTGYVEDIATMTLHFTPATGILLDNTIRAAVEAAFGTFWGTYKLKVHPYVILDQYRWYDQQVWPVLSPNLRTSDVTDVPGTSTGAAFPSQVSCSVTLQTATRRRWGRCYLPGMTGSNADHETARWVTSAVDSVATTFKTFLAAAQAAGAFPVVWSPRGGAGPPAFEAGSNLPVTGIRVDDIPDIVRRRRYEALPYRKILTYP